MICPTCNVAMEELPGRHECPNCGYAQGKAPIQRPYYGG